MPKPRRPRLQRPLTNKKTASRRNAVKAHVSRVGIRGERHIRRR
jgi:hypothetical protein